MHWWLIEQYSPRTTSCLCTGIQTKIYQAQLWLLHEHQPVHDGSNCDTRPKIVQVESTCEPPANSIVAQTDPLNARALNTFSRTILSIELWIFARNSVQRSFVRECQRNSTNNLQTLKHYVNHSITHSVQYALKLKLRLPLIREKKNPRIFGAAFWQIEGFGYFVICSSE